jgi:pimeloyl-ACP methyl ester carboxylesterase
MVGELDNLTPPSVAKEIDALIPNSQLKIIEGAGHLINIEKPKIFNELVLNFLCKFN